MAHWDGPNTGATNKTCFTTFPDCYRPGGFNNVGSACYWWTVTEKFLSWHSLNGWNTVTFM